MVSDDKIMDDYDILLVYGIISQIGQDDEGAYRHSLNYNLRSKTGVILDDDDFDARIDSYLEDGIFLQDSGYLKLGPESDYFRQPGILGKEWHMIPPDIRDDLVYKASQYPKYLREDPLWRLATSPTGKAWVTAEGIADIYRMYEGAHELISLEIALQSMAGKEVTENDLLAICRTHPVFEELKESRPYFGAGHLVRLSLELIRKKMDHRIVEKTRDFLEKRSLKERAADDGSYTEYLLEWSDDFVLYIAVRLKENDTYEISRKDLNIPDDDVNLLSDMLDGSFIRFREDKISELEEYKLYWTGQADSLEKESNLGKIENRIRYWRDKGSIIQCVERCPMGLDSDICRREWKVDDSLDKYSYVDMPGVRIHLSLLYPGIYITPKAFDFSVPVEFVRELKDIIDELHPKSWRKPKNVSSIGSQYEIHDGNLCFSLEDNDDIHPPYSLKYFMSRTDLRRVLRDNN